MRILSLLLLAGCSLAAADPSVTVEVAAVSPITAARARGPAMLADMLAAYDAMAPGRARDTFALAIDQVAGQRYATTARLYWFTDLEAAEAEAAARHVPILSLRMLGNLDEDLSCANSRLFRAVLYANADVGAFLREHFVLHWSSERPVPRVTIDFGDGRQLVRTTTGNSAHYVLDARGRVLDVLPGLYAPIAFRRELERSLALAQQISGASDADAAAAIADYQGRLASDLAQAARAVADARVVDGLDRLATPADVVAAQLALAQRATMSKMIMEAPDLRRFGYAIDRVSADDVAAWASAGAQLLALGDAPHVLDAPSLALVTRLHDATPAAYVATPAQLAAMTGRLERTIVADTALDQLRLRPRIARHIAETGGRLSFADLNAWIYAEVFQTPRADAWLGLLPRTDFTGLPGDGIVTR